MLSVFRANPEVFSPEVAWITQNVVLLVLYEGHNIWLIWYLIKKDIVANSKAYISVFFLSIPGKLEPRRSTFCSEKPVSMVMKKKIINHRERIIHVLPAIEEIERTLVAPVSRPYEIDPNTV